MSASGGLRDQALASLQPLIYLFPYIQSISIYFLANHPSDCFRPILYTRGRNLADYERSFVFGAQPFPTYRVLPFFCFIANAQGTAGAIPARQNGDKRELVKLTVPQL